MKNHNSPLLETIFDTKHHSSLLETRKSWLRFDNNASLLDDLKELNFGTNEEHLLIYINSSLTTKDEKLYFELLSDVFAHSWHQKLKKRSTNA